MGRLVAGVMPLETVRIAPRFRALLVPLGHAAPGGAWAATSIPSSDQERQMRPGRRSTPPRTVVRTYGRDSLLGLTNPVMAVIMRTFGLQYRLKTEQQVRLEMERDALEMFRRGYRIASSRDYAIEPFGAIWYRVTYELTDQAR